MNIAVLGAGHVGGGLGLAWAKAGHSVTFGVPDPNSEKAQALLKRASTRAQVQSAGLREAAEKADIVVLATPWPATEAAIREAGGLSNKIVIDATNPLLPDFSWLDGDQVSGAERVASWAHGAKVFKAFNQTGAENLSDPSGYPTRPVMFTAGDDQAARQPVLKLLEDAGFEAVYAGPLKVARLIEPYAMLWIYLAHAQGLGRNFTFALQRR